jgi:hypothetical protein
MSGPEELERNCRRLLAWYPAWHRQIHGEEMIGVLLEAVPEGKRRPGLVETVNVIWAALLIRLRPRPAAQPAEGWRDALAVFSVVAPVALTCLTLAGRGLTVPGFLSPIDAAADVAYFGLGLLLPLVLLRLRRVAGYVSLLATALLVLSSAIVVSANAGSEVFALPLFAYAAETVALFGSPGPRRGLQLLTWRTWVLTVVAGAAAGVAWYALITAGIWLTRPFRSALPQLHATLIAGAIAVASLVVIVAWIAARSLLGRRVLLIFAVLLYVLLTGSAAFPAMNSVARAIATYLPPLAVGAVALRAAIRSRRLT